MPVVAGGPHVTIIKDRFFEIAPVDFLVVGEGEFTMRELVDSLEQKEDLSKILGLIWKRGKDVIVNSARPLIEDLDVLPFPDREIYPIFKYRGMISRGKEYTQIITSRGCSLRCFYCPEVNLWRCWRKRSPENVVDEIELIMDKYGIKEFHVEDANFFGGDINRIKNLCFEVLKRGLNIRWQCPNGIPLAEIMDLSVLDVMAEAGCYNISVGVESFDDKTTRRVHRRQESSFIPEIVKRCRKNKIEICCYLMIGLPGQKLVDMGKDILRSRRFAFDFIHYSIFHLIPGSAAYKKFVKDYCGGHSGKDYQLISRIAPFILRFIQKTAYFSLCFNHAVIAFVVKRLFFKKNFFFIARKIFDYVSGYYFVR